VTRAVILAAAFLSGCAAAVPAVVGTAIGGGACLATTAEDGADVVISASKPVKQRLCKKWLAQPHHATLEAWCGNLPSDLDGLAEQWAAVGLVAEFDDPLLPASP